MYTYLDRPVCALGNSDRFLLWAMRAWCHCRGEGLCPPRTLRPAFVTMRAPGALAPFHKAMAALDRHGAARMRPLAERRIGEAEALLLALWRDAGGGARPTRRVLVRLVDEAQAPAIGGWLAQAAARLRAAGHDLAPPAGATPIERRIS